VRDAGDCVTWNNRKIILRPRLDAKYENAAVIAMNLWKTPTGWRAIYASIGTQFGATQFARPPATTDVVAEGNKLRLFYCGNGYGATGIGTAIAEQLS